MEYQINLNMRLDAGALQTLLRTLDGGPHGLMRGLIDTIMQQAQAQEDAAKKVAEEQALASAPGTEPQA
jgi:hypothetical protein